MDQLVVVARRAGVGRCIARDRCHGGLSSTRKREVRADVGQRAEAADRARGSAGVASVPNQFHVERVHLVRPERGLEQQVSALDIGAGWGPIALSLGLLSPGAAVWAVDVNLRALDLVRDNAKALGVHDFHAVTPDNVPANLRFDAIWSNPPIRVGKIALHDLLMQWLPRLTPGGAAYLVVQKNLGSDSLQRWLGTELEATEPGAFTVDRPASARGFRLISVVRNR